MITASAIIFMLAFVVLGARPYRVSARHPPFDANEEYLNVKQAQYIYAPELLKSDAVSATALGASRCVYVVGGGGSYATREEAGTYFYRESLYTEPVKS